MSKLKATVRFMFHNPEDVRWFKVWACFSALFVLWIFNLGGNGASYKITMLIMGFLMCHCAACGSVDKMWSARTYQRACWYTWYGSPHLLLIASILSKLICDIAVLWTSLLADSELWTS